MTVLTVTACLLLIFALSLYLLADCFAVCDLRLCKFDICAEFCFQLCGGYLKMLFAEACEYHFRCERILLVGKCFILFKQLCYAARYLGFIALGLSLYSHSVTGLRIFCLIRSDNSRRIAECVAGGRTDLCGSNYISRKRLGYLSLLFAAY